MTADGTAEVIEPPKKRIAAAPAKPVIEAKLAAVKYTGIAIMGSHPVTKMAAPFDAEDWLIYACSPDNSPYGMKNGCSVLPRVNAWFELHKPVAHPSRPYGYLKWLETLDCPIYMRDKQAMQFFRRAIPYPEKELKQRFGPPIFSSSIAYMLAKAIVDCEAQGIKTIGLFGILQGSDTEYAKHLTGTQQFLWEAKKLGIAVGGPHPNVIPAVDDKGNYRQTYLQEVEALKRLLSLEPIEDW